MASGKQGILGAVSGLVGNVVGVCKKNGDWYIRGRPRTGDKSKRKPKQKAQNNKLVLISPLVNGKAKEFFNISFDKKATELGTQRVNLARSVNLKNAITMKDGLQQLDYEKFMVAWGDCAVPTNVMIKPANRGFEISWDKAYDNAIGDDSDRLMVFAYRKEKHKKDHFFNFSGARRDELKDVFQFPLVKRGYAFHLYICFKNVVTNDVSNSVYCGEHTVPDQM
jgi:hypothetical protein